MWRSLKLAIPKRKVILYNTQIQRLYSSTGTSSSGGGGGKVLFALIGTAGVGFAGAIVYGKYDPKFKSMLEANIPFISYAFKLFPESDQKPSSPHKQTPRPDSKIKEAEVTSGLLQKKLDREKSVISQVPKPPLDSSAKEVAHVKNKNRDDANIVNIAGSMVATPIFEPMDETLDSASNENQISDMIRSLEKMSEAAITAHKTAAKSVKMYTSKLYEALELPEGKDGDVVWKEANEASIEKNKSLDMANQKAAETKMMMEKLKKNIQKLSENNTNNPFVKTGDATIAKISQEILNAEAEVLSAEKEAKTATEYQNLVNASKEQFRKELQIVLPNYLHGDKDKAITDGDLNLLIAHAHRRIEQLQKQLAKQQVTEKLRVDQAMRQQKFEDDKLTETKIEAEIEKRQFDLETAVANRVVALKDNFEAELRKQLGRQAAAHADHIQEVLKVQEQELARKHSLELEEKLLHQKGVFISEVSGNVARLRGILQFLKAKSEFDKASKKAQAMWLACQAMNHKISEDKSGNLTPLAKDIAAIKIAADEDSDFINTVLSSIPSEAVNRGVFPNEVLKQRFENVKRVCRRVALVDENNDSLYRYLLSYVQSFLIIETASIPKEELEGKVAVDPSKWDTYDVLSRISYCLKIDDLEQALRYANQLRGEPKFVARDWMNEVRLLLETQLAVKALLAHAAAVGVQAYH